MSRREPHGAPPESGPVVAHVCVTPRWVRRSVIALFAVTALCIAGLIVGGVYVYQQQQYIEGRGVLRDRETAELNRRIDDAVQQGKCDLLDQLPEGGFLDRLRETFGCGPGFPISELPPEVQEELARRDGAPAPNAPPTPRAAPQPDVMGGASPDAPVIVPEPPPTSEPEPSPSPDPLVDLAPVTDLVCGTLPVCPRESP